MARWPASETVPQRMPNRFAEFMNSRRVAATLLGIATVGCTTGVVFTYGSATSLRDHGIRVTGEVAEVHTERRDDFVVVTFTDVRGQEVSAEIGNYRWDPTPQVGDQPTLTYDPPNPSGNVVDTRMGPDFFSVWAFALGAIAAALLMVHTWTGRLDWDKLR